jgi:hypothetical protein
VRCQPVDAELRAEGRDWPADAETMVGLKRLDSLQCCIERVLEDDVPGDLLEAGVWRGGASIFMRGVLKAHGDTTRVVWAADSFQGLSKAELGIWRDDERGRLSEFGTTLAVPPTTCARISYATVCWTIIRFLPGWFRDTLPGAPIRQLALLRLDGDIRIDDGRAERSALETLGRWLLCDRRLLQLQRCTVSHRRLRKNHGAHGTHRTD